MLKHVSVNQKKVLLNMWLCFFAFLMIYPLLWMFFGAFKSNQELFSGAALLPKQFSLAPFITGWKGVGQLTYTHFFMNTFIMVIPCVLLTIVSSLLVAYGFARFNFPFKKPLFILMLSTLMLPATVVLIPRYILFKNMGLLDTYWPFYLMSGFATAPFFIFMLVQFFRSIPIELDEAAKMDGCNSFIILTRILLPVLLPAVFSVGIFQFIWMWSDFLTPLIYISSVEKYPIALALKMSLDSASVIEWGPVMAVSTLSVIPPMLLFFFAQKYFVEGTTSSGIKG